jgi:hypothetical protein
MRSGTEFRAGLRRSHLTRMPVVSQPTLFLEKSIRVKVQSSFHLCCGLGWLAKASTTALVGQKTVPGKVGQAHDSSSSFRQMSSKLTTYFVTITRESFAGSWFPAVSWVLAIGVVRHAGRGAGGANPRCSNGTQYVHAQRSKLIGRASLKQQKAQPGQIKVSPNHQIHALSAYNVVLITGEIRRWMFARYCRFHGI